MHTHRLTAIVSDGEVGALAGQTETERRWLVIFIHGSQGPDHLRRDKKCLQKAEQWPDMLIILCWCDI